MDISRRIFTISIAGGMSFKAWGLAPRPNLFVLVLVELLRTDFLDNVWGKLSNGGFRKLIGSGAYFPDCRHLASTFPSTTLATLATGAWPSQHGIVADSWYDSKARKLIPASDEALLATTLAAQVVAEPRTRTAVIALDSQAAWLFAGTPAAQAFWMDPH